LKIFLNLFFLIIKMIFSSTHFTQCSFCLFLKVLQHHFTTHYLFFCFLRNPFLCCLQCSIIYFSHLNFRLLFKRRNILFWFLYPFPLSIILECLSIFTQTKLYFFWSPPKKEKHVTKIFCSWKILHYFFLRCSHLFNVMKKDKL